ncbi:MAG: hypothetical protein ACRD3W_08070 [Terriglobales bacterium]
MSGKGKVQLACVRPERRHPGGYTREARAALALKREHARAPRLDQRISGLVSNLNTFKQSAPRRRYNYSLHKQ